MAKLTVKEIKTEAVRIIGANPGGIRFTPLVKQILTLSPETPPNTVMTAVSELDKLEPPVVRKPSRGLFQPIAESEPAEVPGTTKVKEEEFYEPFGEWLRNELGEVSEYVALGGAAFRAKWGTPDVLGVYGPSTSDLVKFNLEIVSAEVKLNPNEAITAFGQAAAYRLFSAKTYVAMNNEIPQDDLSRLETLCMLFGVGLVLFAPNPQGPDFEIRVRAQRFSADMFYVNELARRFLDQDKHTFKKLFG